MQDGQVPNAQPAQEAQVTSTEEGFLSGVTSAAQTAGFSNVTITGGSTTQTPKTYDEAYVKELRQESARNRVLSKQLEEQLKALQDAQKTDAERLAEKAQNYDRLVPELEEYRTAITAELEAQKASLPAELLGLMPDGSPASQLNWIRKAQEAHTKIAPPKASTAPTAGRNPANPQMAGESLQREAVKESLLQRIPSLRGREFRGV